MKKIFFYLPLALMAACGGNDEVKKPEEAKPDAPLTKSKNPESFNTAFNTFLNDYYGLKDGLVVSNKTVDAKVDAAAKSLSASAKALPFNDIKADSVLLQSAQTFANDIAKDADALAAQADLQGKRKIFKNISGNAYALIQNVQYDRAKIYHQFCPMAFDGQGGDWLSKEIEIRNPYYADAMLDCGDIQDTLKFNQ